jgi:hypothetical protein
LTKGETLRNFIAICVVGSIVASLLVAGCGGGGDDAQQIDKATFIKQANKICEQASGKLASEIASISSRESVKPDYDYTETQITIVENALVPNFEKELQEIRALGIPEEAKKESEALLKAYQGGINKTKAKSGAVANGAIPYEAIELAATRLGITECPIAPVNAS